MLRFISIAVSVGLLLLPKLAAADPINLKLSFFTSDRSVIYRNSVKPLVDAVNAEGAGVVHIDVYFSGAISAVQNQQPRLVSEDAADLALIVPGQTAERFYDTSAMELAGLFPDARAASRIYTDLAQDGMLAGYEDFYVVGGFVSRPEVINSRKPVAALADLQGLKIRVNNAIEADTLQRFGAIPVLIAINQTNDAISQGAIDAATFPPEILSEFGVGRVATHHYVLLLGGVPTALVMNRRKFESLPPQAQAVIRKYSGSWLTDSSARQFDASGAASLQALQADPRRQVVFPSVADATAIQAVYQQVIAEYGDASNHSAELLARVRADLTKLPTD